MSKIENITEKIDIDAKVEVKEILEVADKKSKEILESSEEKAKKEAKIIIEKASIEAESIVEKALSSAELKARDNILQSKEEVVERVFSMATKKLEDLDSKTYLEYLKKTISKLETKKDLILYVPDKYYEDVLKENLNLNVSKDKDVKSGFVIKSGNIIYNNEFSSLVDAKKGDLEFVVVEKLFN